MWENYEAIGYLGHGTYGKVKKVRRKVDGKVLACKIIDLRRRNTSLQDAEKEYMILRKLRHPNIVSYVDYHSTPEKVRLFMEYCPGGTLQDLIDSHKRDQSQIPEVLIWMVINQLALALRYCHYGVGASPSPLTGGWQAILHRDIKPSNVLVVTIGQDKIVVKLGDYGLSTLMDPERHPSSYAGTRQYQPPEINRSHDQGIRWTKACDIFSLGCTVFTIGALSLPFIYRMEDGDTCPKLPNIYSERLKSCTSKCLALRPEERHDASDLVFISETALRGMVSNTEIQGCSIGEYPRDSSPIIDHEKQSQHHNQPKQRPVSATGRQLPDDMSYIDSKRLDTESGDSQLARSLFNYGITQYDKDDYSEAEQAFRQSTNIYEKILGPDHEETIRGLYWFGKTQYELKKYAEAEQALQRSVAIREKILGPDREDTAESLYWLGITRYRLQKCTEAEHALQGSVAIREKILGPDREDTAESLYWLGVIQYRLQKYTEAEQAFQRSVAIREKTLGPDHKDAASSLFWLGITQYELKKYTEAELALRRSLATRTKIYGLDHPDILVTRRRLSYTQRAMEKQKPRKSLMRKFVQALDLVERTK